MRPSKSAGDPTPAAAPAPGAAPLKVEEVGAFAASFVPTIGDFARLDERFRLPGSVWDKLPQYRAFGFVVFKLRAGRTDVHPMAFSFPHAQSTTLFFPTVHIHDGTVHARADFDRELYLQAPLLGAAAAGGEWIESEMIARQLEGATDYPGLLAPEQHLHKRRLIGEFANGDIVVPLG